MADYIGTIERPVVLSDLIDHLKNLPKQTSVAVVLLGENKETRDEIMDMLMDQLTSYVIQLPVNEVEAENDERFSFIINRALPSTIFSGKSLIVVNCGALRHTMARKRIALRLRQLGADQLFCIWVCPHLPPNRAGSANLGYGVNRPRGAAPTSIRPTSDGYDAYIEVKRSVS